MSPGHCEAWNLTSRAQGLRSLSLPLKGDFQQVSLGRWMEMGITSGDAGGAARGEAQPVNTGATPPRDNSGEAGPPGPALLLGSAEADCLDVLERYRGRCEPTFLFYAGGELVAVVRGANAPLLEKTIREQLEAEKKVLAEGRERRVVKDEALSDEDECFSHEKKDGDGEDLVSSEKACTLAIIKPDAVVHGKTDEIIMKIQEAGFDILMNEERTMTEAEMRLFYQLRAGEDTFEKLVHHMCSGPSHLLILTRTEGTKDVVTAWRTLMGPCDPHVARREQPDSLRAQYGTEMPFNAVHGSWDLEDARRELALLFPSFQFSDQIPESAPLGREAEGAEGPGKMLCSPEDMDEAAHDQGEATS
ncbi:thioredoxin domain-containing protein 6 isoform X1 [Dama dama]|uniref:thioredoxin domain-containing protein 6 isoform X1 n=1 Tax=Dama dama TaxID=30532 RepID=UPI002A3665BE|nr:thioredoxin domain-containing protein 6 isoform X1 [Dama dama]